MVPIKVTEQRYEILKVIFNALATKNTFETVFKDGMVTLRETNGYRVTFIHWYELVNEVVLTMIAKRNAGENWSIEYTRLLNKLIEQRTTLPLGKHPIDFAYEEFREMVNPTISKPATITSI